MIKTATCLLFLTTTYLALCSGNSGNTLQLVHVLFRHGDRTPEKHLVYPNDPHFNTSFYPIGHGQLTNAGKKKLYLMGKALRKRYRKFLGTYTMDTVDARTTDYNRTKVSVELVLASLFPPENELVWEKKLKWQPIPFNYWPIKDDHILGEPFVNCAKYRKLYYDFLKSPESQKMYENYTEIGNYLEKHAGINKTIRDMAGIYFTLTTELENGLELPSWSKSIYPDILLKLADMEYRASTATLELKRLSSGFFFDKVITDTEQKIRNKLPLNTKMFLYSGHEYNIVYLMQLLGIYYTHVPPYGAYILIEIHNIKGIRVVKVFYQDYRSEKPKRMRLPDCQNFCRFDRFVKLYKKYLVKTEKECDIDSS